jgi:hypothetical protein
MTEVGGGWWVERIPPLRWNDKQKNRAEANPNCNCKDKADSSAALRNAKQAAE